MCLRICICYLFQVITKIEFFPKILHFLTEHTVTLTAQKTLRRCCSILVTEKQISCCLLQILNYPLYLLFKTILLMAPPLNDIQTLTFSFQVREMKKEGGGGKGLEALQKLATRYYIPKYYHIKINFDTAIPRLQFILVLLVFQNTTKGLKSHGNRAKCHFLLHLFLVLSYQVSNEEVILL